MILVDFREYGPVHPYAPDRVELDAIYSGCQDMMTEYTREDLETIRNEWDMALTWRAFDGPVDVDWYTRALVCICLGGLLGVSRPNFTWFSSDETKY